MSADHGPSARIALEQGLAEDGDQDVGRVDVEDDPDERPQHERVEGALRAPRQVDVREVLQPQVGEGERGEHEQQADVDRRDHDRRRDGGVQRPARQEVEADEEEDDHPRRGGQLRRVRQGRRDADVEDQQDAEREGGQDRREDRRGGAPEVVRHDRTDECVAVADAPAAGDDLDHRHDRDEVHDPEHDDQRDAGHGADAGHRDRQGQVDGADDQGDDEGKPEGRQRIQLAGQPGRSPPQPVDEPHPRRIDRRQRRSVEALVRLLDCLGVEAQGGSQLRHRPIGEGVLRAQQARDPGPRARVLRDEIGPLRRVAFEILDRRADGQVAPLRQRVEERALALPGCVLAEDDRDRLRSTRPAPVRSGSRSRRGASWHAEPAAHPAPRHG